jgi:DNA-binding XRE family transcriptional regulator
MDNIISRDDLYDLYIIKDKTIEEISNILNKDFLTIIKLINSYDIRLRKKYLLTDIISKRVMTYLYIELNLRQDDLAKLFGCVTTSIDNINKKYGIVKKKPDLKDSVTYEEIFELYYNQDLSTVKIGEIYNVSHATVRRVLDFYDIPKKKTLEEMINKELMIELYENQLKSAKEIAEMYDYSHPHVVRLVRQYGIKTRRINDFLEIGLEFEFILEEIFNAFNLDYKYQYKGFEGAIPDFYDQRNNIIIEAKLNSDDLYNKLFDKYINLAKQILIIYFKGSRNTNTDKILWRHVSYYFPRLIEIGRSDLINKLNDLDKQLQELTN